MMGRLARLALLVVGLAIGCVAASFGAAAAQPEKRVALVIGNNDYQNFQPLENPVNDAENLKSALELINFDVVFVKNTTLRQFYQALKEFNKRAKDFGCRAGLLRRPRGSIQRPELSDPGRRRGRNARRHQHRQRSGRQGSRRALDRQGGEGPRARRLPQQPSQGSKRVVEPVGRNGVDPGRRPRPSGRVRYIGRWRHGHRLRHVFEPCGGGRRGEEQPL